MRSSRGGVRGLNSRKFAATEKGAATFCGILRKSLKASKVHIEMHDIKIQDTIITQSWLWVMKRVEAW